MTRNTEIEKKVEAALDSLSAITRAEPNPFLFTRLEARLAKGQRGSWDKLTRAITRPAVAFLSISLVVVLNMFIVLSEPSESPIPDSSDLAVVDEYNSTTTLYDLENVM